MQSCVGPSSRSRGKDLISTLSTKQFRDFNTIVREMEDKLRYNKKPQDFALQRFPSLLAMGFRRGALPALSALLAFTPRDSAAAASMRNLM